MYKGKYLCTVHSLSHYSVTAPYYRDVPLVVESLQLLLRQLHHSMQLSDTLLHTFTSYAHAASVQLIDDVVLAAPHPDDTWSFR